MFLRYISQFSKKKRPASNPLTVKHLSILQPLSPIEFAMCFRTPPNTRSGVQDEG